MPLDQNSSRASCSIQARTQNIEAQVAATTSQLQQLQASQRQLEARNALLESVATQDTEGSEVIQLWVLQLYMLHGQVAASTII